MNGILGSLRRRSLIFPVVLRRPSMFTVDKATIDKRGFTVDRLGDPHEYVNGAKWK